MNENYRIFATSWFVLSLSLLLLNDFVFKELYGNWFTGKLSDFAGLLIFPLFWTAFFQRRKKMIFIITVLLFILWKSPMSQTFIDGWNALNLFSISRVVDYTDLYALSILPLGYYLERIKLQLKTIRTRPIIPIVVTAFAFCATSYSSHVEVDKPYSFKSPKDSLINRIQRLDSVYFVNQNQLPTANIDTVLLSFPNEVCQGTVDVKVTFEKQKDSSTTVTLLNARYDCPKEDNDQEKIIAAFEEMIIKRIGF